MRSENEYRRFAAASLDLSKKAPDLASKAHFLFMAEAWLDLAERTTQVVDHGAEEAHGMIDQPLSKTSFRGKGNGMTD
jgi:hypothetical protein